MLYVTAIHIGNIEDITLRALKILKSCDIIIGENYKYTDKLLKQYEITGKEIEELNEHNCKEKTEELLVGLKSGKTMVLTTDHGTPAVSDPGSELVDACYKNNIKVICVPGVSSITAALSVAGIKVDDFVFYSKIPRNKEERKIFFSGLRKNKNIKVFIDAPYRLINLLENIYYNLSNSADVILCYELTTERENVMRGKINDILTESKKEILKANLF